MTDDTKTSDEAPEEDAPKPDKFPGAVKDVPHTKRDGYKWSDEHGWVAPPEEE